MYIVGIPASFVAVLQFDNNSIACLPFIAMRNGFVERDIEIILVLNSTDLAFDSQANSSAKVIVADNDSKPIYIQYQKFKIKIIPL